MVRVRICTLSKILLFSVCAHARGQGDLSPSVVMQLAELKPDDQVILKIDDVTFDDDTVLGNIIDNYVFCFRAKR